MSTMLLSSILIVIGASAWGFSSKYNIRLTSESEIENCLNVLPDIMTSLNAIVFARGGTIKVSELSAEVTRESRKVKCHYSYSGVGTLHKNDGKQEQISFKGTAFGDCINK
ncbi:MAG: hypothetical protein BroJett040_08230 [Oligoflexia bacterium]|nr:MAG: hypothetical protein BroJett040_08230 [Oligoflexia bacterium]